MFFFVSFTRRSHLIRHTILLYSTHCGGSPTSELKQKSKVALKPAFSLLLSISAVPLMSRTDFNFSRAKSPFPPAEEELSSWKVK